MSAYSIHGRQRFIWARRRPILGASCLNVSRVCDAFTFFSSIQMFVKFEVRLNDNSQVLCSAYPFHTFVSQSVLSFEHLVSEGYHMVFDIIKQHFPLNRPLVYRSMFV